MSVSQNNPQGHIDSLTVSENITTDIENIKSQINSNLLLRLENEQNGLENTEAESQSEVIPYDPKKIKIRNENWSIKYIFELIYEYKDVDLSPDFQREFVWDSKRKSRLIESLMLGIPIPAFYLSENEGGKLSVVDGLQRLTVISSFLKNEFSLKYLEYLADDCTGLFFSTNEKKKGLDFEYVKRILQTQINVNIIESTSPLKVKYDVFRRINTGGKPLNNQEIRNCLSEPYTRTLLNDLGTSPEFINATGGSIKTTRMDAQELVLRFIGFYYIYFIKDVIIDSESKLEYKGDMQTFLDDCIGKLNKERGKYHVKISDGFKNSMQNAHYLFGKFSFRKCLPHHLKPNAHKQLINKSLFTTWSVILSNISNVEIRESRSQNSLTIILAEELNSDNNYFKVVSLNTNNKAFLETAFVKADNILKNKF
jgi:hypothetical protein